MQPIIRVQGLGKQYQIGGPTTPYSTLRETIMDLARKPVRALRGNGNSSSIWALKDVEFEVAPLAHRNRKFQRATRAQSL